MNRGLLAFFCFVAFVITGCSKGGGGGTSTPDPGQVRVINLIPTAPALQASLNGSKVASVSYGQASPLGTQASNTYDLVFSYLDPTLGNTINVSENASFVVTSNKEATVVITGSLQDANLTVITNDKVGDIVRFA